MRYFSIVQPNPHDMSPRLEIWSEQDIYDDYWEYWEGEVLEAGLTPIWEECLKDWVAVHWAQQCDEDGQPLDH